MNCKNCKKVVPDGFADCPWCGALHSGPAVVPAGGLVSPAPAGQNLLFGMSVLSSGVLFAALNYFAMVRDQGSLTVANSGYFLGRCTGAILLAALLVFGYYKIRGKQPRLPIQLLVIFSLSSLLTVLSMASPAHLRLAVPGPATLRHDDDLLKSPDGSIPPSSAQAAWDPATPAWLKDVLSRNQQYVSEVSKLDESAQPLYVVASFRDAATVQQMIAQLRARRAVADKYADWEPVFVKMRGYVVPMDASDEEKRKFMDGFASTLARLRAAHQALTEEEHAWLQASLDLYQFALSRSGAYVFQGGYLFFKQHGDSDVFNQKLFKARTLHAEFLQAYWESRHKQQAMLAQLGLPGSEIDPIPPGR